MSREHGQQSARAHARGDEDTQPNGQRHLAQMKVLRDFRQQLVDKATKEYPETVMQALLIDRTMLAADAKELAKEKLDPEVGSRLGDTLLDHIKEKLIEHVGESLGIAEHLSGVLLNSFDAARDFVKEQVAAKQELNGIEVADAVINGAFKAMERYKREVPAVIQQIPAGQLLEIRREVLAAKGKAAEADDEVQEAAESEAVEHIIGMPQTGGARTHELAKMFYDEIKVQVRATKPVREQVNEIAEDRKQPNRAEEKAREAEEKMSDEDGSGLADNIKKDESARETAKDYQ